jgi:hypothetical protein
MFWASLGPSSGALDRIYCIWFPTLDILVGVLGSREGDRAHCVVDVVRLESNKILYTVCKACLPVLQDTSQHIKC